MDNSLYNWLVESSAAFGWARTFNIDDVQANANAGAVCLICAQRTDLNRSGHITAVVPETELHQAKRDNGRVTVPLESQAGASNYNYVTKLIPWWTAAQFRRFGFWVHP